MTDRPLPATEASRPANPDLETAATDVLLAAMIDDLDDVRDALRTAAPALTAAVDAIAARMRRGGRLIYLGAGTSGRLAVLDAAECGPTFNTPPELVQAVLAGGFDATASALEAAEDDEDDAHAQLARLRLTPADAVVGLSASGRTPFVLAGVAAARAAGALTVGASCNEDTPLSRAAELAVETPVGPEFLAGSTRLKSGTAQKVLLNAISTIVMIRLGKTFGDLMVDLRPSNAKLVERAVRIIRQVTGRDDDVARAALNDCGLEAKTAILSLHRSLSPADARRLLEDHGGRLHAAMNA